jgi:hypothetical protein
LFPPLGRFRPPRVHFLRNHSQRAGVPVSRRCAW